MDKWFHAQLEQKILNGIYVRPGFNMRAKTIYHQLRQTF